MTKAAAAKGATTSRFLLARLDLTVVGGLILAALGLGVSLLVVQLLIDDRPLMAAATLLVGLGATLTAFKVNRIAVASARLLKEHRRSAARGRAGSTVTGGSTGRTRAGWSRPGRVPGSGVGARPVPGGAVQASTVQTLDGMNKGRNAAAVTEDESRSHKLFAATFGMGSVAADQGEGPHNARRIAGIMSPEVSRLLQARYAVTRLRPDLVTAQLERTQPSAIVLEESALDSGLWFGALRASGGSLFREVSAIVGWARARQQTVYVLPDRTPRPYTGVLRDQATFLVHPGLIASRTEPDVELPLLESLVAIVSGRDPGMDTAPLGGAPVAS